METMILKVPCSNCKKIVTVTCDKKEYDRWKNGEPIQNALPSLTSDEREILISRICGTCFDEMFND